MFSHNIRLMLSVRNFVKNCSNINKKNVLTFSRSLLHQNSIQYSSMQNFLFKMNSILKPHYSILPFTKLFSTILSTGHSTVLKESKDSTLTFTPTRSVINIKYDKIKGRKRANEDVIKRFKRLDWGIWIRPRTGCGNKMWKKSTKRKKRLNQIVFCNATQSHMLDKMVTRYWRKPRVYADDPYQYYNTRENYPFTSFKPKEF